MLDCKIEDPGSMLDEVKNVFALIHRLPKNHKGVLQEPFMIIQEKVPSITIFKVFYPESLKVPGER